MEKRQTIADLYGARDEEARQRVIGAEEDWRHTLINFKMYLRISVS